MSLLLKASDQQEIRKHLERCYPEEGCGFLIGTAKKVEWIEPVANIKTETRDRRYLIDPDEFVRVDRKARAKKFDIIGFYHSHPDHPDQPSEFDRAHAWPGYSYIVVAVVQGVSKGFTSWVLDEKGEKFISEEIQEES